MKTKKSISNFLFNNRYGTIMILVGAIVLFWDLLLKFLTDNTSQTILKNILSFTSSHNTGGAWSIFSGNTVFLIIITILFMSGIVVLNYFYKNKSYLYAIALGMFLSGGFGNLLDRLRFGYVRDFIKLEFMNFPIFNIADVAIVIGVILLFIHLLFFNDKKNEQEQPLLEIQNAEVSNLKVEEENVSAETANPNLDIAKEDTKRKPTTGKKRTNIKTNKKSTSNAGPKKRSNNSSNVKRANNTKKTSNVKKSTTKSSTKKVK